jgi:hypothetical protein
MIAGATGPPGVNVCPTAGEVIGSRWEGIMPNRSKAEVERELEDCAMQVVGLQKDVFELEQQREDSAPPADLEEQIRTKSDALKALQARWDALKAEAESPG